MPAEAALDLTIVRRANALALFQEFVEREIGAGQPPKGLEKSFAERLQISPSMWSQVKSGRAIGTKLARQIEVHCEKAPGWLDVERASEAITPGEQQMLGLCLKAMRATNSVGRKNLKLMLRSIAEGEVPADRILIRP